MRRGYYHKRNYHKSSENIYQYQEGDEIWDNVPTENTVRDRFVGGNTGNNPSFETNPVNYSNHRGRGRYGNNVLPSYVEPNDDPNDSDNDSVSSSNSSNSRSQRFPYRGNVRQNYSNRGMGLLPTSYQSEDLQSFKRGGYSKPANKNNYRGRGKYKPQYQQPASFNREAGDYSLGDKSQNYPQNFVDNANQFKLQANKSFPPSDTSSFSCNDKIALMANFKNFLQNVNPSELVKDYRQRINKLEENCLSKHEKRFKKITSANDIASNKEKIIFQKHLDIIKQQQRTFEQCVTKIKGQLTDIYGLPSSSVYTKCEEIFDEVKCECKMFKKSLPVYAYKSEILSSVAQNQVTIVSVDACYSANEMIPLFICQAYPNDNILSCQPDAGSSIFLAKTCGILAGGDLMNSVGYKTEVIEAIAKDAKIVFISALKLYQDSIKDPNFLNYKTLILHCDLKRSVEVDFLFERLRCCLLERLDFKVILLLSPVKDISTFVSYFSSVTVNTIVMPDIIFPVQTVWKNSSVSFDGDYVNEVIETALAIQALNEQGDVLIFLPTFSDVNKVLKILSVRLIEYQYYDARCISLHKDLSDPSNLSFLKNDGDNSKRRFFLSTSWAELLSLPSVAYIIDTGVQKHLQYDQQRASDLLKQTLISKTRAKLRKYYAGRFSTGICYRLYSKHDYLKKMPPDDVPEVLCKNPLEIMIKLFQYNPTNAMKIEFIENISKEVKEKTLVMLKNANAIKEGKLTTLGGQIVKLPFLPRYSKLIVIGIQWGFPLEAVMLVAYFLVNEPIFIYDTDDKEMQRKVEATKLRYVSFDSDTLTFLNIYKKWMLNDCQESWCIDRALNFNVLMNVQEKIKDIIITVSMNLKENISTDIRLEQEPQYLEIQEMVFDCFKDNLCVYTGHSRSGYHFLRGEGITFLHQSSSVIQRSNPPEYVVFDHLEMKSRPFMMGVTAVPKDIITSATKKGTFKFDETNLLKRKLEPITVENVGVILIRHVLLGKKGRKLMEIEDSIKKETKCDLIVIEPSEEKGNVTIFAPTECAKKAEMMIQDVLRTKLETILNEEETSILQLKKGQVEVPVHITWKKGGLIIHIKPEIHGAKPKVKTIKGETDNEESCMKQCINLRWIRRLCKGFGFLSFAKEDFAFARRLSMTSVIVNDKEADVAINKIKANQLYISGLSDDTSEEDFKLAFNAVLKERFSCDVKIENGHLIFHKPFETTEEELQRLQEHIFDGVYKLLGINDFTVSIPKPKDIDSVNKASITINDPGILEQSAHLLDDRLTIYGYAVKAEPVYYATIICSNDVFFALKEQMDSELFQLRNRLRHELSSSNEDEVFKFNVESKNNGFACLKLSSGQEKVINILQRMVNKWLEGKIITSDNFRKLHKLFTHGGHLWLKTIEHQENVHIIDEYKSKSIRIYGNMQKCDAVVERIRKYLQNTEEEMVKKIDLSRGKHSRTLLKAVLLKYGVDLKNFVQDFELRSAEVNIRKAQLVLHGDPDSVEKAMTGLEDLASSCSPDVEEELASSQELCCTCIMPPLQSSIRLEHCGHLYCVECLKGLITNAKFPILCSAEKCEKELILEDIRRGLDYDDNEINHLLDLSMTDFIMQHKEDFTYCPAPDCSMFFNKKEIVGTKWRCTLCQNDICIKCNIVFHHGYTCEMYQGTKDDPNYSVKLWLTNTKANCKPCPKCKTGIEKNEGCDHMTCYTCHTHFCWICVTAFPDGGSAYRHTLRCKEIQAPYL